MSIRTPNYAYEDVMTRLLFPLGLASLLFSGAIFGFFYAWVCSTMWGLDAADPRIAIAAMQAMNGSVRNAVFAPAFFATPAVLMLTAVVAWRVGRAGAGAAYAAAGALYLVGGLVLTMAVNVPMNEALAQVALPDSVEDARAIWDAYSGKWQLWNGVRTVVSAVTLLLAGCGLWLSARNR